MPALIRLIKQGAALVESADDVLRAIEAMSAPSFDESGGPDHFDARRDADLPPALIRAVREALSFTPIRLDEIVRAVDTPHRMVLAAVAELALAGEAVTHVGGMASRAL